MSGERASGAGRAQLLPAAIGAWFAYAVIDFLSHAVVMARWWRETESFWLPPRELFLRIPYGYAAFAIYCTVLMWLLRRIYGDRLTPGIGLRFGAIAGLVSGAGTALGTYSALRMPSAALLVWPASTMMAFGAAGAAGCWILVANRPWRRVGVVIAASLLLFVAGVVIQSVFLPTPATH